jgi:hypothetical protein
MKAQSPIVALLNPVTPILCIFLLWTSTSFGAFTDVTSQAGLTSSAESRGAAWSDYDGDDCVDLYVSDTGGGALYKNNCDGTFTDVTASAGVGSANQAWGAAWGDYDGDSDLDLYVGTTNSNALYRNNGDGTFSNVASSAGVADDRATAGVSWADFDSDGDLDLFIVNRFPGANPDLTDGLYRNNGDGTFTDVAADAGVAGDTNRKSFMGVWFDYDNDGNIDLYISVDFGNDVLYRNNGNGTFDDVSFQAGITDPQHGMGVAVGDVNQDGCMDVLSTNNTQADDAEHNASALYINNCNGTFSRMSEAMDVLDRKVVEWGANFVDYDNDTDLDLSIVAGGMLTSGEPNVLYESTGSCDGSFFDITAASGVSNTGAAFGSVWADYDNDGDLDWFIANETGSNVLLRNDGPSGNHLKVKLYGAGSNTRAIGAVVKVTSGGVTQSRVVQAGTSYASAEESHPFFGLGVKTAAERVSVLWPSGTLTELSDIAAGNVEIFESGSEPPPPPPPPPPGTDAVVMGTAFNPSGIPEENVQVRIYDPVAKQEVDVTFSDASGQYSLTAPAGSYKLQARKVNSGYKNFRLDITLTEGEILNQDVTLTAK